MILSKASLFAFAALIHASEQRASTGRSYSSDDDRPWDDFGDYSDDVQVDELLWDDVRHRHIYLDADGNWAHRDFEHEHGQSIDEDSDSEPRLRFDQNANWGESDGPQETSTDHSDQLSEDEQSDHPCMHLDAHDNWECSNHGYDYSEDVWYDHREASEANWDRNYSEIGHELDHEDR